MDQVRELTSVGSSLRKGSGLRVRLPLANLTVVTAKAADLEPFSDIIREELNLKNVTLVELSLDSTAEFGVAKRLNVNARAAGPRLGKNVQTVIQAAKAGNWTEVDGVVSVDGVVLEAGEYELDLVADFAGGAEGEAPTDLIGILPGGGFLILDGALTPELADEGLARDAIRLIQQARKDAGLDVSDRIKLTLCSATGVIAAITTHVELVKAETLTVDLTLTEQDLTSGSELGDGQLITIEVSKS
jgi:isoleucyl-tRNA synthetase